MYSTAQIKVDTQMHISCEYSKLNKDNTQVGCECMNVTHEPVRLDACVGIHRMLNHLIRPYVNSWSGVLLTRKTRLTLYDMRR